MSIALPFPLFLASHRRRGAHLSARRITFRKAAASGPSALTPDAIAGLQVWFRSDTVSLSGSDVLTWTDKSGNGRNLTYLSTRRPTYSAGGGINGLDKLVYTNSTGGTFSSGTQLFDTSVGVTVVSVARNIAAGVYPYIVNIRADTATKELRMQVVPSLAGYLQLTCSIVGQSASGIGLSSYYSNNYQTNHWLMCEYNGLGADTAANWRFTINGAVQTTATDVNALTTALNASSHGTVNPGTANFDPGGDWYELFVYNHPLSTSDKAGLELYLSARYGLSSAVFTPSDRPAEVSIASEHPVNPQRASADYKRLTLVIAVTVAAVALAAAFLLS